MALLSYVLLIPFTEDSFIVIKLIFNFFVIFDHRFVSYVFATLIFIGTMLVFGSEIVHNNSNI